MMYMQDAIYGTISLMEAEKANLTIDSSYNIQAISFSPNEIYQEIKKVFQDFQINYIPDFRQQIADTWPISLDDSVARSDWGWSPGFDLSKMVREIIEHLQVKLSV